jgi:hypothetical protein
VRRERDNYDGRCTIKQKVGDKTTVFDIRMGQADSFLFATGDGVHFMHGPEEVTFTDHGSWAVFRWSDFRLEVHEDGGDHAHSGREQRDEYRNRSEDADAIVRRAYQDILDREPDEAGLRSYRSRIIDDHWTEAQVREALRTSPEHREENAMTQARAEEVVRRAYLAVLEREPDPASRPYVDRVFRDKWTQADVERELRKSAEFLRKH